jgi:hypothetical protein
MMEDFGMFILPVCIFLTIFLTVMFALHYLDRSDREETKLIDQIHDCWDDGKVAVVSRDNVSCKEP